MSLPSFSHPAGSLDPTIGRLTGAESAFTALGYAIQKGDLQSVREYLEGDEFNHQLLQMSDYAGNTALVSLFLAVYSLQIANKADYFPLPLLSTWQR